MTPSRGRAALGPYTQATEDAAALRRLARECAALGSRPELRALRDRVGRDSIELVQAALCAVFAAERWKEES